jgi:hypothetical protein
MRGNSGNLHYDERRASYFHLRHWAWDNRACQRWVAYSYIFVAKSEEANSSARRRAHGIKADSYIACRAHAVPLPCRTAKCLECVFPIWFTQCSRVWFALAMPRPCHALTMPFFSRPRHSAAVERRPWATCPRSVSSGYHAEFHEDYYQKHTNPPHNDPYLRL